jgi:KaiC/GvpD/RAD55 family RecA-like ATPase
MLFYALERLIGRTDLRGKFLLIGPGSSGKTLFAIYETYQALLDGMSVLFVTTNNFPVELVNIMKYFGYNIDPFLNKKIKFLDLYSAQLGFQKESLSEFIEIGPAFSGDTKKIEEIILSSIRALKCPADELKVVLDDISTFFLHIQPQEVIKFYFHITGKLLFYVSQVFSIVNSSAVPDQLLFNLESCSNGVIVFERCEDFVTNIKIRKLPIPFDFGETLKFRITSEGIFLFGTEESMEETLPEDLVSMLREIFFFNRNNIFPSINELAKKYKASRETVRKKINELNAINFVKIIKKGRYKLLKITEKGKKHVLKTLPKKSEKGVQ